MSVDRDLIRNDIEGYLDRYEKKDLLRFVTVGSVDDGKSTLIGRLLHDTGMVYEDQIAAVRRATTFEDEEIDFSLFTDGLRAEREQGITIDVAYRYFTTEKRKFIIADTPGHVQYTRNMVTGASTANVSIILIDARLGVQEQSRRHAYIASLLGIPHLAVCVNKMDLVGYDERVFDRIRQVFQEYASKLQFKDVTFFPVSAKKGVNIARTSASTPWFSGTSVLEFLESVPIASDRNLTDFRFPVQYVIRPNLDYRGFAGEVAAGTVAVGDEVVALPSGRKTRIAGIDTAEGTIETASTPRSVVLRLEHEIDLSRGDMLVHPHNLPAVSRRAEAHLVWMSERPLDTEKTYLLKHTTQLVRAQISHVHSKVDMQTMESVPGERLELNDIGRVSLVLHRAICFDPYTKNRTTGAFIIIDSLTNDTVGAGMLLGDKDGAIDLDAALRELRAGSALRPKTQVSPLERRERMGQSGALVWLTGLPGSGRWTLAYALERRLFDLGRAATVVDPTREDLRSMISAAGACTDAGLVTICAFPSFKRADRDLVRDRAGARFVHVYVNTSIELCRERRPDADFTGFEPPEKADVTVALESQSLDDAIDLIVGELDRRRTV